MSLFKKKAKAPQTIQEAQQEFNSIMFRIGSAYYQKHMKQQEIAQASEVIVELTKQADKLGERAMALSLKAKAEMAAKAAEGASNVQESTQATE